MGASYLLDSNIIIYFMEEKIPADKVGLIRQIVDSQPQFSVITQIEILGFKNSSSAINILNRLVDSSTILSLSSEVVAKTIEIRKSTKIRLPDAIIAATALHHKLVLLTRNINDFKNIPDLKLENPYSD